MKKSSPYCVSHDSATSFGQRSEAFANSGHIPNLNRLSITRRTLAASREPVHSTPVETDVRLLDPVFGPRRSRSLRVGLIVTIASATFLVFACVVQWRVEGTWGEAALIRGRLNLQGGHPIPPPRYAQRFQIVAPKFDPSPDFHFYPAQPSIGRARWWFVRVPLWIPVVVVSVPTLVYWFVLVRARPPWQCRGCGYDLRGTKGDGCPECGRGALS
jgi:hypothetical protein